MTIKITDHLFQYGSDKFFRGSAYKMELGTFGEKKDPIGPKAYLAVEGKIKASHLADRPIHQGKPMEIDWLLAKVFRIYRMLRALQRDLLNRSNEPLDRTIDNPQRHNSSHRPKVFLLQIPH